MKKITNISDKDVELGSGEFQVILPPGKTLKVKDVKSISNLPEIRRQVRVGENLNEVPTHNGKLILG